jgi:hypothetical protein
MNASILTSSAALNGLTPLRWNAFSQAATGNFAPLAVSFMPAQVTVFAQQGAGRYPSFAYQFNVYAGSPLPPWVQAGTGVLVNASVTVNGKSINLSSHYIVKNADPMGNFFVVNAPSPSGSRDAGAFTQPLAQTNLDNGAAVSLVMQAQKAMFGCSNGSVVIAPVVDAAGNAPDGETITAGQAEYEITAPTGCKFDLADWQVRSDNGGTLFVRFL